MSLQLFYFFKNFSNLLTSLGYILNIYQLFLAVNFFKLFSNFLDISKNFSKIFQFYFATIFLKISKCFRHTLKFVQKIRFLFKIILYVSWNFSKISGVFFEYFWFFQISPKWISISSTNSSGIFHKCFHLQKFLEILS